ncbi:EpsG family protein [Macrococcoides canis]|uniref:EpsG family protein n=1 Tax=Macrococcoides canis TaxID=1855823 RepID=UPI0013050B53|nr:EpsG family protein [Macrococcus canis]
MYYLILLLGIVFSLSKKLNDFLTMVFAIILVYFASIRYGVGNDYFGYFYLYKGYLSNPFSEIVENKFSREEIGFRVIASTVKYIGLDFQYLVTLFSVLTILCVYIIAKKYSVYPMTTILVFYSLFYIVWVFSGMRQGFTIFAGLLLILYCYKNNKNLALFLGVFLLFLIHKSALLILPIYYLSKLKIKINYLTIITMSSIILSVLPVSPIFYIINKTSFSKRIENYEVSETIMNIDFQSIVRIIFVILILIFYKKILRQNQDNRFIIHYYLFGMIIYFLFKDIELVAARLSIYSRAVEILLIPMILKILKDYKYSTTYGVLILIYLFAYFSKDLYNMNNNVYYSNGNNFTMKYSNIYNYPNFQFKKSEFYQNVNFERDE